MEIIIFIIVAVAMVAVIILFLKPRKFESAGVETSSQVNKEGEKTYSVEIQNSETNEPFFIVVDVETTGIYRAKEVTANNYKKFPRIVQIAWILLDKDCKWIGGKQAIIRQDQDIPYESIQIHNITNEIAREQGVDIIDELHNFNNDLRRCKILVAHNIEFDVNVIASEMMRTKTSTIYLSQIHQYCTMIWSTDLCKIPKYKSEYDFKYPKLEELVKFFFFNNNQHYHLSGFHDAVEDAKWTALCLPLILKARGQNVDNFNLVDLSDIEIREEDQRLIKERKETDQTEISAKDLSAARAYLSRNKDKLYRLKSEDSEEYTILLERMQERYDSVIKGGYVFKEAQEKEFKSLGINVWKI